MPAFANVGRFQFTGQAWVPESGLYYFKARFYSASLGRFLQTDPIGYGGGMKLYAYVRGDPVNFTDPMGLDRNKPYEGIGGDIIAHVVSVAKRINDDFGSPFVFSPGFWNAPLFELPTPETVDPKAQDRHSYKVEISLGMYVSPREGFDVMRNFSAPGIFRAQDRTREIELPGGNWIEQSVDTEAMTITNVAIQGRHVFGGYVRISMYQRNGVTAARIEGGESGPNARENQFWGGAKIFEALGVAAFFIIPCNSVGAL